MSEELRRGYQVLGQALERAVRQAHQPEPPATAAQALRDAQAARAVWELVHLHLVAVELQALWQQPGQHDELELVLLAEHQVEKLADAPGASDAP